MADAGEIKIEIGVRLTAKDAHKMVLKQYWEFWNRQRAAMQFPANIRQCLKLNPRFLT